MINPKIHMHEFFSNLNYILQKCIMISMKCMHRKNCTTEVVYFAPIHKITHVPSKQRIRQSHSFSCSLNAELPVIYNSAMIRL